MTFSTKSKRLGSCWAGFYGSGSRGRLPSPNSHTTVRTVPYTAVPVLLGVFELNACCPISTQPYLTGSARYFRFQGSLAGHLLKTIRKQSLPCSTGSALHRGVSPTTMASADFCQPIPAPFDAGSSRQVDRSPRVRHVTFIPYTRRIYFRTLSDDYWALDLLASSPECGCLICGSCSSGRDFAFSFLPTLPRDNAVAVQLVVPAIRAHRGLTPPSPQLTTTVNQGVLAHHAPCLAHQKKERPTDRSFPCLIFFVVLSEESLRADQSLSALLFR